MSKLLSYPLSVLYYLAFGITLVVFHPIQWFCFNVFGYSAHKTSVDVLQFCLIQCLRILGTRFTFEMSKNIPQDRPLILVSNHQSMYDISPIMWYMRKHHPKFISKIELGKGIPSVSYNLRHGGSALIDRKNPRQSLPAIMKFGEYIESNKRTAVIFPEGTRSKDGTPKRFQTKGLEILLKKIPSAAVLPLSINNSWKLVKNGAFPMGIGIHLKFKVHEPIEIATFADKSELLQTIEQTVSEGVHN
ncbi:MAG: 1-acyl-sn-glycerol-3-phosphate acyltransferase [Bacteroidetes bacterium MedPE-SWsnd-G2]|nr:MAG: 1-acyl-sn-glycerol-3-phosphate acyltransferase [Bacteroidetes bacterium MedPE-SWsnd-G2]